MRNFTFTKKILSTKFPVLLLPILFAFIFSAPRVNGNTENLFSIPRITNGDEPHYLVAISSWVNDFDFDVSNNYENARNGGLDAGFLFAGRDLDHHSVWYEQEKRFEWQSKWGFAPDDLAWQKITEEPTHPEYPTHPIGLALFIGSILKFLQTSPEHIEPYSLIFLALFSFWAFHHLRIFLSNFSSPDKARTLALLCIISTPLWHYSRALYGEMFIVGFALAGTNAYFQNKLRLSGAYFGLATMIKPVFLIFAFPYFANLLLDSFRKKNITQLIGLSLPLGVSSIAILSINMLFFGSPFHSPQEFRLGNISDGLFNLLLSPSKGILGTAPVCLFFLVNAGKHLQEKSKLLFILPILGSIFYLLVMSLWEYWAGGTCYGPRLIVPILPFMFAFSILNISKGLKPYWNFALTLSIAINLVSISPYWRASWDHPVKILIQTFHSDKP